MTTLQADDKPEVFHVDRVDPDPTMDDANMAMAKGQIVQFRSELDDMSVWQAAKYYKRIWILCMLAAFSASLEGYRKSPCETELI